MRKRYTRTLSKKYYGDGVRHVDNRIKGLEKLTRKEDNAKSNTSTKTHDGVSSKSV